RRTADYDLLPLIDGQINFSQDVEFAVPFVHAAHLNSGYVAGCRRWRRSMGSSHSASKPGLGVRRRMAPPRRSMGRVCMTPIPRAMHAPAPNTGAGKWRGQKWGALVQGILGLPASPPGADRQTWGRAPQLQARSYEAPIQQALS